jgi:L-amino acid N-acyltransferase YncA
MPIRDATLDDLPAIVEIYNSTVATRLATADTEPVSIASRERWFSQHSPTHRPLWVAVDADRVTGWLSYSSFYGRSAYEGTCELSVYIALEYRRQGLATELLSRCIQHAPRIGVMTLLGFVFGHNKPSLSLFEKLGFRHWGCLPRVAVLDGMERDLVIVGRRT